MKVSKLNSEPIEIDFKIYEPKSLELEPCFKWDDEIIYLKDCIRTPNPWDFDTNLPKFIHGYFPNYPYTLLIEIVQGYAINLYEIIP